MFLILANDMFIPPHILLPRLAPYGAIFNTAIAATGGDTWIGMDKQLGIGMQVGIHQGVDS